MKQALSWTLSIDQTGTPCRIKVFPIFAAKFLHVVFPPEMQKPPRTKTAFVLKGILVPA
jgi:hypothetical protein